MTLGERSKGKARPRQVRSSDLVTMPRTDSDRPRQRDASGRFTPGNAAAIGRGAKAQIKRQLGRGVNVTDEAALLVMKDANRLFGETMLTLPSDDPTTRQLCALYCRHASMASFWSAQASVAGLGTDEGIAASEQATKHGQRAERVAVTMLDVARTMAASRPQADPFAALEARIAAHAVEAK